MCMSAFLVYMGEYLVAWGSQQRVLGPLLGSQMVMSWLMDARPWAWALIKNSWWSEPVSHFSSPGMRILLFSKDRMNSEDDFCSGCDPEVNYQKASRIATGKQDIYLKELEI